MDHGMNDKRNSGLKTRRMYEQNLFMTPVQEGIIPRGEIRGGDYRGIQ